MFLFYHCPEENNEEQAARGESAPGVLKALSDRDVGWNEITMLRLKAHRFL